MAGKQICLVRDTLVSMTNPLLSLSPLPYHLPQWSEIKPEHIVPAVKDAMKRQRDTWDAIANNTEPATKENLLEAVDASWEEMNRIFGIVYTLISSVGGPELEAIEAELGPELSEHSTYFTLNTKMFERFESLNLDELDEESAYFASETLKSFRRAGIDLPEEQQNELKALNKELSAKEIAFGQRVVAAMSDNALQVESKDELAGLDEETIDSFADGDHYTVQLINFTNQPYLAELTNPATRKALLETSMSRGLGGHASSDTRQLVSEIATLRAKRAALLGHTHHASVVAEAGMAQDSEKIIDLLSSVAKPAIDGVERERAGLAKLAQGDGIELGAADWQYYESKKRGEVAVDDEALKPYLLLDNVVEKGIFYAANKLYGITFEARVDLEGYLPSVKTWEVKDADGAEIGLFQADFFARKGKHGGAWMNPILSQSRRAGLKPVIMNNCNFAEPAPGKPCLLSWDHVITVFHEFGHALHGLLSDTYYLEVSGTSVPRDFVELPSQLNEMWAFHPDVLAQYAVHYQTGEALPAELADKLAASMTFGQGFATAEFLASALLDQAWHRISADEVPSAEEVEAFEEKALKDLGVFHELVPPRYRSTYFNHTFGGGYDAGYYSYMWAEVLVADLEDWFRTEAAKGDGGLNREAGDKLRGELLSRGSSRDPMESFIAVRGRQPRAEALLERRGL